MKPRQADNEIPDFLIKTTLGCSIVVLIIVIPFTVNNFIQGRLELALATTAVNIACFFNVWQGYHGRYSLWVNTFLITPTGAAAITLGMVKLGGFGSYWSFLLVLAYYFVLPERRARIFNIVTGLFIIPLAWFALDHASAARFSAVLIGVSLFAYISIREINTLHGLLKAQAVKDQLTGCFNRSLLDDSLQQAMAQSQRSGLPMALISLDIDHFKSINDTLGHDKGDLVLKKLGRLLKRRIRSSDMAFRVGGDEFLVLYHGADEDQGADAAEKLRQEVARMDLLPDRKVTISVGVSGLRDGMDVAAWVKSCDEKMYRAKDGGRNRVVV